jgi:hypothetical protein
MPFVLNIDKEKTLKTFFHFLSLMVVIVPWKLNRPLKSSYGDRKTNNYQRCDKNSLNEHPFSKAKKNSQLTDNINTNVTLSQLRIVKITQISQ